MNCFNKSIWLIAFGLFFCQVSKPQESGCSLQNRKMHLERLLKFFEVDDGIRNSPRSIRVSPLDKDWMSWLSRTGELPPDFSIMPGIPFIPDPLIIMQEGRNIPIESIEQWETRKSWIRQELQYWITGKIPPSPENFESEVISEEVEKAVIRRKVLLSFGEKKELTLHLDLLIPPEMGPFPVFLTQYCHEDWGRVALRRGYIVCLYAGSDSKDDTDSWDSFYYPEYDFSLLMRRAWAAHRAVDYLFTLPLVDKEKIGIIGHSRNGKQALLAAAFDERIKACIPSSAGTGGEIPFRYTTEEYTVETIKVLTGQTTAWFHPRLRFFAGNEYKLPVDQNFLMALVAPRHLMISTAYTEPYGNPWGAEQMYHSVKKIYDFLGSGNHLAIQLRYGGHGTLPFIIEDYLDFFDFAFGIKDIKPPIDLLWNYSFENWKKLSGEDLNPMIFPEKHNDSLITWYPGSVNIAINEWEEKRDLLLQNIQWSFRN